MLFNILLLLLISVSSFAQFPTTLGTRWEYFQYLEDVPQASSIYQSFKDEVIADTLVGSISYLVVERTGQRYWGSPNTPFYDNISGHYYYRVVGNQVRVLDSLLGQPSERLLYDFGVAYGDTLLETPVNLLNLTRLHTPSTATGFWDLDSACAFSSFYCNSPFVRSTEPDMPPWQLPADTYQPLQSIFFRPGIGTLYSFPFIANLAVYGQHYYLGRMFENDQEVYTHPMLIAGVNPASAADFLQIGPNPTTDRLQIHCLREVEELRLVNALGQTVAQQPVHGSLGQQTMAVDQLPRGSYWLVARSHAQMVSHMVVLQ